MSNRLNLADAINDAFGTGKEATFHYNDTLYEFSPVGIVAWLTDIGFVSGEIPTPVINANDIDFSDVPISDPEVAGQLWSDGGVLTLSAGEIE